LSIIFLIQIAVTVDNLDKSFVKEEFKLDVVPNLGSEADVVLKSCSG